MSWRRRWVLWWAPGWWNRNLKASASPLQALLYANSGMGAPGGGDDAMVAALAAHQRPQREWPLTQEQVAQAYQAYTDRLR